MIPYVGDFVKNDVVRHMWNTYDSSGGSVTRSVNGTISVYEDGGITQFVAGVTDTEDFDTLTGVHLVAIDTSDANYEAGKDYIVVLSAATIAGQSVNAALFSFSIQNRIAVLPAIPANWLTAAGIAAGALDGKGNWNIDKTGYAITTLPTIPTNWLTSDGIATSAISEIAVGVWTSLLGSTTLAASSLLQLIAGLVAGKVSGAETSTVTIRNVEDTGDLVVATVDGDGNRSAVTITPPSA